jgi:hypothetical protein
MRPQQHSKVCLTVVFENRDIDTGCCVSYDVSRML